MWEIQSVCTEGRLRGVGEEVPACTAAAAVIPACIVGKLGWTPQPATYWTLLAAFLVLYTEYLGNTECLNRR